jgi:hypothetical protein
MQVSIQLPTSIDPRASWTNRRRDNAPVLLQSLGIAACAFFAAGPASAYYVKFAAEIVANAAGPPFNCCSQNINTGELVTVSYLQTPISVTDSSEWGQASVAIQGESALGRLRVLASGSASETAVASPDSFYSVSGAAFNGGSPQWHDTLTMGAGTFTFTATLISQVSGGPISASSGTSEPGADCGLTNASFAMTIEAPSPYGVENILHEDQLCDGDQGRQVRTFSRDMTFLGGEQIPVTARLSVRLFGDASPNVSPSSVVDALHTAIFTVVPVSPGATYSTESGVLYLPSPDSDGDGVPDDEDAFPADPTEWVDTDGDGVGDNADALPNDPNETVDTDGDGIGNNADTDDDNDGVLDEADAFPLDPAESVDTDNDGIGNNADTDDDNDGLSDADEATYGTDPLNADTDGDGVSDSDEIAAGTNPLVDEVARARNGAVIVINSVLLGE